MSERAATRGDNDEDITGHINLEQGLDIVLNCEVNQRDPAGITAPYRLLVPALRYAGPGDPNILDYKKTRNVLKRLTTMRHTGRKKEPGLAAGQGQGNWGKSDSEIGSDEGIDEAAIGQRRDWYNGRNGSMPERNLTQRNKPDWAMDGAGATPRGTPKQQQRPDDDGGAEFLGQNFGTRPATARRDDRGGDLQRYPSATQETGYSAHVTAQPQNSGYPGRKLSKAERMMGVGSDESPCGDINNNGGNVTPTGLRLQGQSGQGFQDVEDGYGRQEEPRGYSGIEAYGAKQPKWKRYLSETFGGK